MNWFIIFWASFTFKTLFILDRLVRYKRTWRFNVKLTMTTTETRTDFPSSEINCSRDFRSSRFKFNVQYSLLKCTVLHYSNCQVVNSSLKTFLNPLLYTTINTASVTLCSFKLSVKFFI